MLPKIIASSVIRSSRMGSAHGGLFIIDLETEKIEKTIDWDDQKIDWDGRGGERGLRGIAYFGEKVFLASSSEIYVYDNGLELIDIIKNDYMKYNHEIFIDRNILYITSTGYDSIILYDLVEERFINSFCIRTRSGQKPETSFLGRRKKKLRNVLNLDQRIEIELIEFDPNRNEGPKEADTTHINNVFVADGKLYFSGTVLENLYRIEDKKLIKLTKLHFGTHNVTKYKDGYLLNNTYFKPKQVSFLSESGELLKSFPIISYSEDTLTNTELSDAHAVQSFGRGLCYYDNFIIGGSSPATISVHDFNTTELIKSIQLSNDLRNAIHGLEIWPF